MLQVMEKAFDEVTMREEDWQELIQAIEQQQGGGEGQGQASGPDVGSASPDQLKQILAQLPPEAKQQEGYKEKFKKELIEESANDYNFIGNNKKPYYLINWISRGAVPSSDANPKAKTGMGNSAGFLFYETGEGFNFRSIDLTSFIESSVVINL